MAASPPNDELRQLAEHHAQEAERLLKGAWISSHVKAQAHASLAVYYESLLNAKG
jgi:Tfp pilus assembly protein PilF